MSDSLAPARAPSRRPPAGLAPSQCPQFIVVGCDDNQHADGIEWVLETFRDKTNPIGKKSALTFDGAPARVSFYVTGVSAEDPRRGVDAGVLAAWKAAYASGHEIANHAWSHAHGGAFTVAQWREEIERCNEFIAAGTGLPRDQILGFRAPFLEYNENAFTAARQAGMLYDTSVQLGWGPPASGGEPACEPAGANHFWPFTLDDGLPETGIPGAGAHPGLWEIPVDPAHFPPELGFKQKQATGFDWNLWFPGVGVTRGEFLAILKHTLHLKYHGNRAPMNLGLHAYIYSQAWASAQAAGSGPRCKLDDRRAAVREFVDHALSLPDVRLVGARELLQWLRRPAALA